MLTGGHTILAIEPTLPDTPYSPDYLIETQGGQRIYVECTVATGTANEDLGAKARLNAGLSAIEDVVSPRWFLSLNSEGMLTAPIKTSRLRRQLIDWIAGLPEDDSALTMPPFLYTEHGAKISLRVSGRGAALGVPSVCANWRRSGARTTSTYGPRSRRRRRVTTRSIIPTSSR